MRKLCVLLALVAWSAMAGEKLPLPQIDDEIRTQMLTYLATQALTPEDYVVSKFRDHDVVFVGEFHRIKHDVELIQSLIPRVYKAGVYTLGFEFARREDQPLIDKLLSARNYDEALAREIQFRSFPVWAFQEYVDIYHVAWELNRSLPRGARKFRILALADSPDWSFIKSDADSDNPALRKKVWRGGGEDKWAKVILDEVARGRKVLVYCGMHHAFTSYEQPIVDSSGKFVRFVTNRVGNHVYRAIGKRAFTISLHAPWYSRAGYEGPFVYAADGAIDALMATLPPKMRRVGFDTADTIFGQLTGDTSVYSVGYDRFTLETFCDGYIIQMPLSQYEGVTPIPGFINARNVERAKPLLPNPSSRTRSPEELMNGVFDDADIPRRFARFH